MDKQLINVMRNILNSHDPIGIFFGKKTNFDEYDPEIEEILKTFKKCKSLDSFTDQIHMIFQKMFSIEIAGDRDKYTSVSKDLWKLLNNI